MKKCLLFIPVVAIIIVGAVLLFTLSEPTIPVNSDFLQGDWVDEQGFVLNVSKDAADIYIDTGTYSITYENGMAVLKDVYDTINIKGKDENTIIIEGTNIEKCYAYRESSEKGSAICKDIREKVMGCWKNNIFSSVFIIVEKDNITSVIPWQEEVTPNEGEGIRFSSLEDFESAENVSNEIPAVRVDGEEIIFSTATRVLRFKRADVSEAEAYLDLRKALAGEWTVSEEPFDNWIFSQSGFVNIGGERYLFTARADHEGDFIDIEGIGRYELLRKGNDNIVVTKDGESLELFRGYSEEIEQRKRFYEIRQINPELFSRYPDNAQWLISDGFYGSIPLLADADYIDKSLKEGVFTVSNPEELASVTYYINAYLTDGQSEKANIKIEIIKDIDLSEYEWCSIGWNELDGRTHYFNGCINGNNHSLSNLSAGAHYNYAFTINGKNVTVKDLTIKDAVVYGYDNGVAFIGTGCDESSVFDNCHFYIKGDTLPWDRFRETDLVCTVTNSTFHWEPSNESIPACYVEWDEKGEWQKVLRDLEQISLDGKYTVVRPRDIEYNNICWNISCNGKQVLRRLAENEYSYTYFRHTRGTYEIYLEAYIGSTYARISNVVSYTID